MPRTVLTAVLFSFLPAWAAAQPSSPPRTSGEVAADEQMLKAIPLSTSSESLLDFFHKRAQQNVEESKVNEALKQLSDKAPETHNKAIEELVKIGHPAVPSLRRTMNSLEDANLAARAKKCLQAIEGESGSAVALAAARLLVHHHPAGAAEALLGFVPFAEDREDVTRELEGALFEVAVVKGEIDKAILQALKDESPARRAFAARILCQVGNAEQRKAVVALLKDPKPTVRFEAALGLARQQEGFALPVLIELLAELPPAQRQAGEDFLLDLAGDWAVVLPKGNDRFNQRLRREVWLAWWKATEGPSLLEELKDRTVSEPDRHKLVELLKQLTSDKAEERQAASVAIIKFGKKAIPVLRRAQQDANAKLSEAATKCLQTLESEDPGPLSVTAIKLLALRKPAGAAEAMLAYLPFADSEELSDDILHCLPALALQDGKPDPALVKALHDPLKVRRLAAIEALAAVTSERETIRKLLKESDGDVRLKAALGLASAGDREAVPVLIDLLADGPVDQLWQIEDYLARVAAEKKPTVTLGTEEAARKKAREVWAEWWKTNGDKVELVKLAPGNRLLGYTLVVEQYNNRTGMGRVLELDPNGKPRWEINQLNYPMDAQVVSGDRVLIAEQNFNRVSERDFKGKMIWQKQVNQPFVVQRLRNGNTFISNRNQLFEVDRNGKDVVTINRMQDYLYAASRLRDGGFAFVNSNWNYIRLDRTGKQLKTWRLPLDPTGGSRYMNVLENGNVLLSEYSANKVKELDNDGKVIWEATVTWPNLANKLPNGNVLVTVTNQMKIVEIDRAGKVVREFKDPNLRPWKASRR